MAGQASLDAFLTFNEGSTSGGADWGTIDGETNDTYEKQFKSSAISNYTFHFSLPHEATQVTTDNAGDSAVQAPELDKLSVSKPVDIASPRIFQALCDGVVFDKVWIWQKKPGGDKTKSGAYFFQIELRKVYIVDVNWTASDGDPAPQETIQLQYMEITVSYAPQDNTGKLGSPVTGLYAPKAGVTPRNKTTSGGASDADIVRVVCDLMRANGKPLSVQTLPGGGSRGPAQGPRR